MGFLNHVSELTLLRERLEGSRAEFLVVYGRRRVGKTELLAHLASEVRSFYFVATDTVPAEQLRDFTDELVRVSGDELLQAQPLTNSNWSRSPRTTLPCSILAPAHVTKILTTLERLGLAAVLRPVTASQRAKKTAYEITDQFLRFHYRFVESARSASNGQSAGTCSPAAASPTG